MSHVFPESPYWIRDGKAIAVRGGNKNKARTRCIYSQVLKKGSPHSMQGHWAWLGGRKKQRESLSQSLYGISVGNPTDTLAE